MIHLVAETKRMAIPLFVIVLLFLLAPCTLQQEQQTLEIPETKFSCEDRVPGYYADPETGCQVYHMCGAGGRKFSYRCPEQTLFQQRMMVCDHWFMVDCKSSPLHYAANLLLGDKTKPFIAVGESVQREFVPDAKAPRTRADRLSFGTKKITSSRRAPITTNQKDTEGSRQNGTNKYLADVEQRTFPTTLFQKSTTPFLSPETINSEIIGVTEKTVKPTVSTFITKINQHFTSSFIPTSTSRPLFNQPITSTFNTQTNRPFINQQQFTFSTQTNRPPLNTATKSTLSPFRIVTQRPTLEVQTTKTTQSSFRFFTTPKPQQISRFTLPQGFQSFGPRNNASSVTQEINFALETTQSLPETTTFKPTTTYNEELFYPSTINSLLRNSDNDEPALLQIIPDTRRMFFIPHNFENIPSDFEEQNLEFQPNNRNDHIRAMRFNKDIGDFHNGACPSKCIPAFFRPGSCEPCVILR